MSWKAAERPRALPRSRALAPSAAPAEFRPTERSSYGLSPTSRGCPRDTTRSASPAGQAVREAGIFDSKTKKGNPDVLRGRYSDPKTSGLTGEVVKDRTQ